MPNYKRNLNLNTRNAKLVKGKKMQIKSFLEVLKEKAGFNNHHNNIINNNKTS